MRRIAAAPIVVFILAFIGLPALAAAPDDAGQPATTQQLIQALQGGSTVFRADPHGAAIHLQSGMVCVPGAQQMRLSRLFVGPTGAIGDDVGCDYVMPDGKTTVFATRLGTRTLQAATVDVARAIKLTFPDAQQISGPMVASYPGLQTPIAGSWSCTFNGKPSITSVWLVQGGDWLIEVRATYPAGERHDPELLASMAVINAQMSISKSANQ
jgi:hypothetical protein